MAAAQQWCRQASPDLCSHHRFSITIVPASYATENHSGTSECQTIWWEQAYLEGMICPPDWTTYLAKIGWEVLKSPNVLTAPWTRGSYQKPQMRSKDH